MSIYKGGREVSKVAKGARQLAAMYKGVSLVWMAVRSCFGSGLWIGSKPWIGTEKWKGHK